MHFLNPTLFFHVDLKNVRMSSATNMSITVVCLVISVPEGPGEGAGRDREEQGGLPGGLHPGGLRRHRQRLEREAEAELRRRAEVGAVHRDQVIWPLSSDAMDAMIPEQSSFC